MCCSFNVRFEKKGKKKFAVNFVSFNSITPSGYKTFAKKKKKKKKALQAIIKVYICNGGFG